MKLDYSAAQLLNGFCLVTVYLARDSIGIFHYKLKIRIFQNAVKARPVACGNFVACSGIINILDSEFTQYKPPIRLSFGVKIGNDAL